MNFQKLFTTQKILDDRIVKEKELDGQDLLDERILALQVELGELANEWRGFKFWSEDREPTKKKNLYWECGWCEGSGTEPATYGEDCHNCEGQGVDGLAKTEHPLLEEYVDCLHFILSIGNEFGFNHSPVSDLVSNNIVNIFNDLYEIIPSVKSAIKYRHFTKRGNHVANVNFQMLLNVFSALGWKLGFTWQQIEQAYFDKNKINHERQDNGY